MTTKSKSDETKKKENDQSRAHMMTQVVEIVDDDDEEEETTTHEHVSHEKNEDRVEDKQEDAEKDQKEETDVKEETDEVEDDTKEDSSEPEIDLDVIETPHKKHPTSNAAEKAAEEEIEVEEEKEKETVKELFSKSKKNETDIAPEVSAHTPQGGGKKTLIVWAFGILIMVFTIGAGLLFFAGGGDDGKASEEATPTPTTQEATATPTPTPQPVEKEELSVQVLNGSGEVGAASKMKEFLEGLGYVVEDTGNADEYSYEETEVSVKESAAAILDGLQEELEESYVIGSADADLSDDYDYDIRVTVGAE